MSEKPEALRLADILQAQADRDYAFIDDFRYRAAAELRRQHAKIERLREALEIIAGYRQCVDPLMGNQDVAEATLRRDAERFRWGVENARWVRHEHEAYVAIPVAVDADLSCTPMRTAAIDAAMKEDKT